MNCNLTGNFGSKMKMVSKLESKEVRNCLKINYVCLFLEQFEELAELDCEYGFERFVNHSELYPPSDFVKNDYIYICCEITQKLDYVGFKQILLNDEKILKHVYRSNKIDDDDKVIIQSKKRKLSVSSLISTFIIYLFLDQQIAVNFSFRSL